MIMNLNILAATIRSFINYTLDLTPPSPLAPNPSLKRKRRQRNCFKIPTSTGIVVAHVVIANTPCKFFRLHLGTNFLSFDSDLLAFSFSNLFLFSLSFFFLFFFFFFLNKDRRGCQQPLLPLKPSIPSVKLNIHTQTLPDQAHYKQLTLTASIASVKLKIHTQTLPDQTHCKQFTFYCKHPYRKP